MVNNMEGLLARLDGLFITDYPGKSLFRPGFENIGENPAIEESYPQITEAARLGPDQLKPFLEMHSGQVDFVTWHLYSLSGPALTHILPKIIRSFIYLDMKDKFDSSGPLCSLRLECKHGLDDRLKLDARQIEVLSRIFEIHFLKVFEEHRFDDRLFSFVALFNDDLSFIEKVFSLECRPETRGYFLDFMVDILEAAERGLNIVSSMAQRGFFSTPHIGEIYGDILNERGRILQEALLGAKARDYIDQWLAS